MPVTTRGITTQNSSNWFTIPHQLLSFVGDYPSSLLFASTGSLTQSMTLFGYSSVLVSASNGSNSSVIIFCSECLQESLSQPLAVTVLNSPWMTKGLATINCRKITNRQLEEFVKNMGFGKPLFSFITVQMVFSYIKCENTVHDDMYNNKLM